MADKQISDFTAVTTLNPTDIFHLQRGGADKQLTGANLKAEITTTGINVGTGQGVLFGKVADEYQFKSLKAGANITITPSASELLITAPVASGIRTARVVTTAETLVQNDLVAANSSGGAFSLTMPLAPTTQFLLTVVDYSNNWGTNNVTLLRNGSNFEGAAEDLVLDFDGGFVTLAWFDATQGWKVIG